MYELMNVTFLIEYCKILSIHIYNVHVVLWFYMQDCKTPKGMGHSIFIYYMGWVIHFVTKVRDGSFVFME